MALANKVHKQEVYAYSDYALNMTTLFTGVPLLLM